MISIAGFVAKRPYERLRSVFRPVFRVVERRRVPDDFVHDLRSADGVGGGAWALGFEGAAFGVAIAL